MADLVEEVLPLLFWKTVRESNSGPLSPSPLISTAKPPRYLNRGTDINLLIFFYEMMLFKGINLNTEDPIVRLK